MKAIVTVGLGFGDEGKGATVDYLARQHNADLVVRYSGGAQAGHNVELPDGRRHTFSQFGAGTLAGVPTYLGPRMIINPSTMLPEADHLRELGVNDPFSMLTAHPACLVSTYYHVLMNRLRELARGGARHGSCGLGIGETRNYWLRYGTDAVFAKDINDRRTLVAKLTLLRDRFLLEMQELTRLDHDLSSLMHDAMPAIEADELLHAMGELPIHCRLPNCDIVVFEGAQGVLLDEWKGFHPHTTWSTVTPQHALEIAAENGITDVLVLGVTRAYSTRHGAGPFPTASAKMSEEIIDIGNPTNAWQGSIRCGPLDLVLLKYAASVCRIDGLVVNCLDHLTSGAHICNEYSNVKTIKFPRTLKEQEKLTQLLYSAEPIISETSVDGILDVLNEIAPVMIAGNGPTHSDRIRDNSLTVADVQHSNEFVTAS